jgi:hypothetical protein
MAGRLRAERIFRTPLGLTKIHTNWRLSLFLF